VKSKRQELKPLMNTDKQTKIARGKEEGKQRRQAKRYAMLAVLLGWFCFGCGKSPSEPAASVPIDCQKFLEKYFDALKSKDVGKIQEFSSYVSPADSADMPAGSVDMMRETKRKFAADAFERMNKELGDFKSYSVLSAKVKTITTAELVAGNMQGLASLVGTHAEIVCKAKFSKKRSALIILNLFKDTPESEYSIEAWRYQAEL